MVSKQWNDLPNRFPNIALDQFIVMPNHIHGIVQLVGAPLAGARVPNAVSHNNYHYDGFRATMDNDRVAADNDRATADEFNIFISSPPNFVPRIFIVVVCQSGPKKI